MPTLLDLFNSVKGTTYHMGSVGGRSDFGPHPPLFDCSGFVAWAFYRATGGAVKLPAFTDSIASSPLVERVSGPPQKGDIVLYDARDPDQPGVRYEHTAIYDGAGGVIQAGGIAHNVNRGPINELPNPTYWRVKGVDAAALFDSSGGPVTNPSAPVTAPFTPPPGVSNPNPNPQQPITAPSPGGQPVAAGGRWDLFTNGSEGVDWVRIKVPSPTGGDWLNFRVPTPVGIAHAIGWGIHDAIAGWIPRAPGVTNESLGVPIAFYMLGGLAVLVGGLAIGFQAIDAAASNPHVQNIGRVAAMAA